MTNAKEAAERLRPCPFCGNERLYCEPLPTVGCGKSYTADQPECWWAVKCTNCGNHGPTARPGPEPAIASWNKRAEHLPDDDEPITEEWWDTINESHEVDSDNDIVIGEYFVSFNRDWANTGISVQSVRDDMQFPHVTTRGQLRLLLRALQPTSEANRE